MPFPVSQRVVFAQNPISEVICQLRFPTILEIAANPPAKFQNQIRASYPLFESEEQPEIPREIAMLLGRASGALQSPENSTYKFLTAERSRFISLSSDFVAVTENAYVEWQNFRAAMENAKQALEAEYAPSFYDRIGLRYVNVLDLQKLGLAGREWRDLLNPYFVGLMQSEDVSPMISKLMTQVVFDLSSVVPNAKATVRYGLRTDPAGTKFVLDSDFYLAERTGAADVLKVLNCFNELDGNLFRWLIPRDQPLWRALQPR